MPVHPLETYLSELRSLAGIGVPETSGYPILRQLLDTVGRTAAPRIRCVIHLANTGAGIPDGGLFSADQFPRRGAEPREGALPSAGAIEVKAVNADLRRIIASEQVAGYVARYGQVLVTNYREFVLLVRTSHDTLRRADAFVLAGSEAEFWELAAHPRKAAEERGDRFLEFLTRVVRSRALLYEPADVAWFLASYARDAMDVLSGHDLPALASVRSAFEQALGITFEGEKGDHFFRSSLVQTLFYGIFSGWVLWSREHPPTDTEADFDWKDASWYLRVPMIAALFDQIARPTPVHELGIKAILDRTGDVLNRVDRAAFFRLFNDMEAVQYFYEPFLEAFDPELRKELGVWYTPREIVRYMVARVDTVLREELDIPRGLADPRVYVLDPCCGTGAYLVEVLLKIQETKLREGGDALGADDVRRAAVERVFGFEILPAPFVVAHLQLGLLLQSIGAPLGDGPGQRAGVFLTNALTGWDQRPTTHLPFPELEQERDRAEDVKLSSPILVILGNPPYNGFAGMTESEEERGLTVAYRTATRAPAPQGQGLNDLYVRFFRMAERKIVEKTGQGVVCFISNYSWLDGLSHTGMRERYLEVFDRIWIDNLHGDRIISEYAPDGQTSETVFATQGSSVGIKIGTAISLLVRSGQQRAGVVGYRDWDQARAAQRRASLVASASQPGGYHLLNPAPELGLPFKPRAVGATYLSWPRLPDLFPVSFPGVKTSRDDFLVDIDRERLLERLRRYFDARLNHEEVRRLYPEAMHRTARFDPERTRDTLVRRGLLEDRVIPYLYRPFDIRWVYWEPETKLLDEKRSEYVPHVVPGNLWIEARQRQPKERFDRGLVIQVLADNLGNGLSSYFPLQLEHAVLGEPGTYRPNLAEQARAYLAGSGKTSSDLFFHAIATLHTPLYREENAGALRQDWPRIPLPREAPALKASAGLGRALAALLDPETPAPGITHSPVRPDLSGFGILSSSDEQPLDPSRGDLSVTAGWGYHGGGGTMPGRGRVVERPSGALNVYLNSRAFWANVPAAVWEYALGGHQVIKKWLSYRERELLGRDLTPEEARYVTEMVRRIAAILALGPALDENYEQVKADAYPWPRVE